LAGFAAPSVQWAALADEWQAALDEAPKLHYFKMKEAARLQDQFDRKKGWDELKRDDRLITLTRIINKYTTVRINVSIDNDAFSNLIRDIPAPQRKLGVDSPYIYAFMQIILAMASSSGFAFDEPCDFIFDEQGGFSTEANDWWPTFKESLKAAKSDLPKFVADRPIFRNEKNFLPLQASDLYAWQLRSYYEVARSSTLIIPPNRILRQLERIPAITRNVGAAELSSLRANLLLAGKAFKGANPNGSLFGYDPNKRVRKKARKKPSPKKCLSRGASERRRRS
jgi:hypothetical protein